jgi:hypothetical protein
VKLKSITSGKAVLWRPVTTAVRATMPGNRHPGVAGLGEAEVGQDLAEDEQQEQRLQDHLGQEHRQLAAR